MALPLSAFEVALERATASIPREHRDHIFTLLSKPSGAAAEENSTEITQDNRSSQDLELSSLYGLCLPPLSNDHDEIKPWNPAVEADFLFNDLDLEIVEALSAPDKKKAKKRRGRKPKASTVLLVPREEGKHIGIYGPKARAARLEKHRAKRLRRDFHLIRYACRRTICVRRSRAAGRFLKRASTDPKVTAAPLQSECAPIANDRSLKRASSEPTTVVTIKKPKLNFGTLQSGSPTSAVDLIQEERSFLPVGPPLITA